MDKTDKEVLELCKSWFEDIMERSDRLTTGNVSHVGRAIHGVAINYAEYVYEHLHNSNRGHKVTWSEEDEKHYQGCLHVMNLVLNAKPYPYYNDYLWLKSLKERYTWKPSDEQMNFLWKYTEQNNYDGAVLTSLFRDLKKLREE